MGDLAEVVLSVIFEVIDMSSSAEVVSSAFFEVGGSITIAMSSSAEVVPSVVFGVGDLNVLSAEVLLVVLVGFFRFLFSLFDTLGFFFSKFLTT